MKKKKWSRARDLNLNPASTYFVLVIRQCRPPPPLDKNKKNRRLLYKRRLLQLLLETIQNKHITK